MTDRLAHRLVRIILAIATAGVVLGGCNPMNTTPISEINASPANFDGKEVVLRGVVKAPTRLPLLNLKSYVLKDDSGEIDILTEGDLPKVDEKISVRVKVANIAIINGEPLGTTVTEIARH
ncbi:hypothetical protein [Nitrosospira sp. NRS527]|uniref:hypothetical protein n=1 Tax=Nitrosospira sp. NRS527 TaxID=155925 RepID=UPI001AF25730|nr:hypothetical protein [Nitrosospira sp. NRS527]BCT66461.1 hypothetical protein NNRS527_00021 [Nitrosospira sp. NRS527]